jgi:hypothetical protein
LIQKNTSKQLNLQVGIKENPPPVRLSSDPLGDAAPHWTDFDKNIYSIEKEQDSMFKTLQ